MQPCFYNPERETRRGHSDGYVVPADMVDFIEVAKVGFSPFQVVDFEVTVRADEKSGREGGLSVVSAVFGIGAGIKNVFGKKTGHAATLRFRVPIKLPESGDANRPWPLTPG